MQGATKERWLELCELAAKEQDPRKLLAFAQEITHLLDVKKTTRSGNQSVRNGEKAGEQNQRN